VSPRLRLRQLQHGKEKKWGKELLTMFASFVEVVVGGNNNNKKKQTKKEEELQHITTT
jgi:hypothetical protein